MPTFGLEMSAGKNQSRMKTKVRRKMDSARRDDLPWSRDLDSSIWELCQNTSDNKCNHKNYNFLDCDWFKKNAYFPLIHLPSCYQTVYYWTVYFRKFKVALNPLRRIFLNFAKTSIEWL